MKERVLKEFKTQYAKKFKDESLLNDFFKTYVLETITDTDLLAELNKNDRDLNKIEPIDYLENESIIIRTIRVCVLLELAKDYDDFKKLNKKIAQDKYTKFDVEFDKLLQALMKVEAPN